MQRGRPPPAPPPAQGKARTDSRGGGGGHGRADPRGPKRHAGAGGAADTSRLEEEAGDLDAEDAIESQPLGAGESRYLQKQIHLEKKKKEVGVLSAACVCVLG